MKRLFTLLLLAGVSFAVIGCEASGKIEDEHGNDKAKVKIDTD